MLLLVPGLNLRLTQKRIVHIPSCELRRTPSSAVACSSTHLADFRWLRRWHDLLRRFFWLAQSSAGCEMPSTTRYMENNARAQDLCSSTRRALTVVAMSFAPTAFPRRRPRVSRHRGDLRALRPTIRRASALSARDSSTHCAPGRPQSVGVYAVNYAATFNFLRAAEGAADANNHVQFMANTCPATRLVLGGFSQGAAVVDLMLGVSPVLGRHCRALVRYPAWVSSRPRRQRRRGADAPRCRRTVWPPSRCSATRSARFSAR